MQQINTILQIAREQGLLPLEKNLVQDSEQDVELTEDEIKAALAAAKKAKYYAGESQRYWDRVKKLTTIPTLTSQQYLNMILERAAREIKDFQEQENQTKVYQLLAQYFTRDPLFEKAGYSFKKGIVLFGGVGCGKTSMMRMFVHNPLYSYVVISCRNIAAKYAADGEMVIYRYSGEYNATMVDNPFQCRSWGLCFDDLGTETDQKHFGNQMNVMENILLNRYDNFNTLHSRTHITTNLDPDEIEQQYGTRVRSRMREMFNLIDVSGNDLRK